MRCRHWNLPAPPVPFVRFVHSSSCARIRQISSKFRAALWRGAHLHCHPRGTLGCTASWVQGW